MVERVLKFWQRNNINKEKIIETIKEFLQKEGAKSVSIFGSFARDEEKLSNDIDIIVEFQETKSLLNLVRIERELSELLDIKVDLITKDSISPYLKEIIDKEKKVLYAK